jgi:hypothetical protein
MRTKLRYYLDDVNQQRWSEPIELDYYLNLAYKSYYNELIDEGYKGLLATPSFLDTTGGIETVSLPSDFYKAFRIDKVDGDRYIPLRYKENYENEICRNNNSYYYTYSFRGENLVLNPIPSTTETNSLRLIYYPEMVDMSDDTDEPVAGFKESWQEMIPVKAAILAKAGREEDDVTGIKTILIEISKSYNNTLRDMSEARINAEGFNFGDFDNDFYWR